MSLFNFFLSFCSDFQSFSPCREAAHSLMCLRQGQRSVLDYTIKFRALVANCGCNNGDLIDAYLTSRRSAFFSPRINPRGLSTTLRPNRSEVSSYTLGPHLSTVMPSWYSGACLPCLSASAFRDSRHTGVRGRVPHLCPQ